MLLRVDITQEDINQGKRGRCNACPIALAVERELPLSAPVVRWDTVIYRLGGFLWTAPLPKRAQIFMRTFDAVGPRHVRPFAFDLEVPNGRN